MSRLPYVDDGSDVVNEIRSRRNGALRPLDMVLLNSPAVARGWNSYLRSIREQTDLDGQTRELLILRVAALTDCQYEWDAHAAVARTEGMTEDTIRAIGTVDRTDRDAAGFGLLIDVVDNITTHAQLPDELYSALEAQYSNQQVLEIVATVATYNMVSRVLNALRIGEKEVTVAPGE